MPEPTTDRPPVEVVVVFAGGGLTLPPSAGPAVVDARGEAAVVIGADSGVDRGHAAGVQVDIAVGDFDSVSAEGLAAVERAGGRIERHPAAKDATDLALALDIATALTPQRVVVIGDDGGRLDHLLASALVLAEPSYAAFDITAYLGAARVHVVRPDRPLQLDGTPGELVSLLPVSGHADGVTTEGLRYPLAGEPLAASSTRGVSNEFASSGASVRLDLGTLLVILPGERGADPANDERE